MKKLMVYLDEEMHEDLRLLAFRKRTTMAALVRYALDKTFEDDLDIIASSGNRKNCWTDTRSFRKINASASISNRRHHFCREKSLHDLNRCAGATGARPDQPAENIPWPAIVTSRSGARRYCKEA